MTEGASAAIGERVVAAISRFIRAQEVGLILLAALVGALAGGAVSLMDLTAQWLHETLFLLPDGTRLSAAESLSAWRALLVPAAGGFLVACLGWASARLGQRTQIDPIEANALYGGRLSLAGSTSITLQTLLSNGFGASVGMEAGYAQIGSGLASRSGTWLKLRRNDLRVLVGCGAAAAIAAAFGAPLAGAFYGFELILGFYTITSLLPVLTAALVGHFVTQWLGAGLDWFDLKAFQPPRGHDYAAFILLGLVAGLFGIAVMRGVTFFERLLRGLKIPALARPVLGGLAVGGIGLITPMALGASHGALQVGLTTLLSWQTLLLLLVLKSLASALSLGSGFRGGLFSTSLFLGAVLGTLYALLLGWLLPGFKLDPTAYAIVGMSAAAAAIIGGPLTMALLALEMTGELPLASGVLLAVCVAALTVRRFFGYSFATWRFHLRGVNLRGAQDVGWLENLTAGRLMRNDPPKAALETTVAEFRRQFPLGGEPLVVVLDQAGRYAGIVAVSQAHLLPGGASEPAGDLSALLLHRDDLLLPDMNVKEALVVFDGAPADALVVVDDRERRQVLGLLTEVQALKRYSEELDRRRREETGAL